MIASPYAELAELLAPHEAPCLSLYQPTHRAFPASQQNPIRYKNLLGEVRAALGRRAEAGAAALIAPLERLQEDTALWNHPQDGLAAFSAPGYFRVYRLQRSVPEFALVADSLHVKPLVRILQTKDAYQVLVLDRDKIALYQGNRDALDAVELAAGVPRTIEDALGGELTEPYSTVGTHRAGAERPMHHGQGSKKDEVKRDAERYFRVVDKAIHEHHSRSSGLPLVLAALPEHQGLFRQVSRNPFLLEEGLPTNAAAMEIDELRHAAWKTVEPHHHQRTCALAAEFSEAVTKGLGSDRLGEVGAAAVSGRVATLMLAAERRIGGCLDPETGLVEQRDPERADIDDVLDDIAVIVLRNKGEVRVIPEARMPTQAGIAAIFRY